MSRTYHHHNREKRIRNQRMRPSDLRRLAHAIISLAEAEAERQAEAEYRAATRARLSEAMPPSRKSKRQKDRP
jgi:hypothetical protein